jgi:hypothetical protein
MLNLGRRTLLIVPLAALAVAVPAAPAVAGQGKSPDVTGATHGKPAGAGTGRRIR